MSIPLCEFLQMIKMLTEIVSVLIDLAEFALRVVQIIT
jgi:hypothetical protein